MSKEVHMEVIENENDYGNALIRIDYLMSKGELTIDEQEELKNLGYLVDSYEQINYSYPPVD